MQDFWLAAEELDLSQASQNVLDLLTIIGPRGFLALVLVYGGNYFYVSKRPHLEELLGAKAAVALRDEFAGTRVWLPSLNALHIERRNARIRQLRRQGGRVSELGTQFGLSMRQIQNVTKRHP